MMTSRHWLRIDSSGESTTLDVDKYAIIHRVQIHARDLRILDPNLLYPSTIFGRDRAIVLNFEHIKAIITSEEVLLRNPSDENVKPVVTKLQRRLPIGNEPCNCQESSNVQNNDETETPFEFRALEVVLEAICSFLTAKTTEVETAAYSALDELTLKVSGRSLDRVRKLKNAMTRLTARVLKVKVELEQLLADDDDMADLYLTRKLSGASSPVSCSTIDPADEKDVEELEMLLEAYFIQIHSTLDRLTRLRKFIDDTEDYTKIKQNNHRNQLIQLEVVLSSANLSIQTYSLIAGIYGMNIPYTWNDGYGYMFKYVVSFTGILSLTIFGILICFGRYKKFL